MSQWFAPMLVFGAIAIYIADSARLLYCNEAMLVRRRGRWRLMRPSFVELASRRLYLPNPLAPYQPVYRLHWTIGATEASGPVSAQACLLAALSAVGAGSLPLLAVLAMGIPMLLLGKAEGEILLLWMGLAYLCTLSLLGLAWHFRTRLGLSAPALGNLTLECLLCPPLALNLVRKLSLRSGPRSGPLRFAAAVLDDAERELLRGDVEQGFQLALDDAEPDGEARRQLVSHRDAARALLR